MPLSLRRNGESVKETQPVRDLAALPRLILGRLRRVRASDAWRPNLFDNNNSLWLRDELIAQASHDAKLWED